MRRLFRFVVLAGIAAGIAGVLRGRAKTDPLPSPASVPTGEPWPPLRPEPEPTPAAVAPKTSAPKKTAPKKTAPKKTSAPTKISAPAKAPSAVVPEPGGVPVAAIVPEHTAISSAWVEPGTDGTCPPTHPVKAKMSSKIFHSPGQLNYDRTTPDRCYTDAGAAVADGLRAAKR